MFFKNIYFKFHSQEDKYKNMYITFDDVLLGNKTTQPVTRSENSVRSQLLFLSITASQNHVISIANKHSYSEMRKKDT